MCRAAGGNERSPGAQRPARADCYECFLFVTRGCWRGLEGKECQRSSSKERPRAKVVSSLKCRPHMHLCRSLRPCRSVGVRADSGSFTTCRTRVFRGKASTAGLQFPRKDLGSGHSIPATRKQRNRLKINNSSRIHSRGAPGKLLPPRRERQTVWGTRTET